MVLVGEDLPDLPGTHREGVRVLPPSPPSPPRVLPMCTAAETDVIVRWIIANVDADVVPNDEGNGDALAYNLVQLARHGPAHGRYRYRADQDKEIESWRAMGRE